MKTSLLLPLMLVALCGCTSTSVDIKPGTLSGQRLTWSDTAPRSERKEVSEVFFGEWSGRFSNGELAFRREWTTKRFADGTFVISFKRFLDGRLVDAAEEKGKWWIESGLYHETMAGEEEVHSYRYFILTPGEILFEKPSSGYTFIDRRNAHPVGTTGLRPVVSDLNRSAEEL